MRKWRLRHLLFSWFAYWLTMVSIKLGSAIAAAWVASQGPPRTSEITFNWGNEDGILFEVLSRGEVLWRGTTTIATVIGWAVVPPLILWMLWLWLGARDRSPKPSPAALAASPPDEIRVKEHVTPIRERR